MGRRESSTAYQRGKFQGWRAIFLQTSLTSAELPIGSKVSAFHGNS
jgi:hypothetical protein